MSEHEAGSNVDLSNEPLSAEIGSGDIESDVIDESGLSEPIDAEAVDELAEEVETAIEEGATDEEIKELVETFKIKVNGEERDVQLDWNNKDDIVRRLQMAEAGQEAMQQRAEMEKTFEEVLQEIVDDPWRAMEELGLNPDKLAEQRIEQQIQQLRKTPEQIAQEEKDAELEKLRQELQQRDEEKRNIELSALQREAEVDLDREITDALSATTELPKSQYVVKRIADAMLTAINNGYDDVKPADVIPWVEREINEELQTLFDQLPDKSLSKVLGNKTVDRLRHSRLAKMKTETSSSIKSTGKREKVDDTRKKVRLNEWLKHGKSLNDF